MINIVFEQDKNRAAAYDGELNIGEATFAKQADNIWVFDHTYVDSNYGGQGIAKRLIEKLVEAARENSVKVIPTCPYAKKEFEKNLEYRDLLLNE